MVVCGLTLLKKFQTGQKILKKHFTTKKQSAILFSIEKPLNALIKDKGCSLNEVRELSVGARQSSRERLIPFVAERLKKQ